MSPYTIRIFGIPDQVEDFSTLDAALERAKKISKSICGTYVAFEERGKRVIRAFADNGKICWAVKCDRTHGATWCECIDGYRREKE